MKNRMLLLVIGIPLSSVLFGMVMIFLAVNSPDQRLESDHALSKTSWRQSVESRNEEHDG